MLFNMLIDKYVLNNRNGIKYYSFPILSDTGLVTDAFSTREGGVSKGIYSKMNLSLKLDDNRADVMENIRLFCDALELNSKNIVMSNQTHSNKVRCVDERDIGTGIYKAAYTDDVDGLITNVSGIVLMTFYADCVPVYFLDEKKKVIALSHSGWRGTYNEITKNTIELMNEKYECEPENIKVVTGPCICKDCYEVSIQLGEQFANKFSDAQDAIEFSNNKCHLDLSKIIKNTALSCGIKKENFVISGICTCCQSELLHSHRATGGKRGLNAAVLCLKD